MIVLSRSLARVFRAVLRRCLLDPGSRHDWPLLLARSDGRALTLQACRADIAVRYSGPAPGEAAALAFRASVLAEFEGRTDAPVTLEQLAPGRGRAQWTEAGVPQAVEFDTVTPDTIPELPEVPARLAAMPEEFLAALGEASRVTAREATRYAVTRVQLQGQAGQVVATDGRHALIQGGFHFPWKDTVVVPRLPLLDLVGSGVAGPIGLCKQGDHVILRVGDWTFWLATDGSARFPSVEDAIPRAAAPSRLRLDPKDAAFLATTLPKLPGRDDDHAPVTLDLSDPPAVRARPADGGQATEAVLARSTVSGPAVRVVMDRHYLHRAARLGFAEVQVVRPDVPLVCRDEHRTYLWMPLDGGAAVLPGQDVLRIVSAEGTVTPPDYPPPQPRRRTAMPAPPPNGRPPEDRLPPGAPERNGGIDDLIAEAESLRNLLADASARSNRLVAALKQHRRQAKAVRAAVASLRGLQLDG